MSDRSSRYRPVRALERGLTLLLELNRTGRATPSQLAKATQLDRTTVYRLMATLIDLGYVEKSASSDCYVLSHAVQSLSDGFTEVDRSSRIAAQSLARLCQKIQWPSDYAVFDRGHMTIRESTHRVSPYSIHRGMIGRHRPLLRSSLGRAVIARSTERRRQEMLMIARNEKTIEQDEARLGSILDEIDQGFAERGYAWAVGGADPRVSAIAVPVECDGVVFGAVNVIFFKTTMDVQTAARKFLRPLSKAAREIGNVLNETPRDIVT